MREVDDTELELAEDTMREVALVKEMPRGRPRHEHTEVIIGPKLPGHFVANPLGATVWVARPEQTDDAVMEW